MFRKRVVGQEPCRCKTVRDSLSGAARIEASNCPRHASAGKKRSKKKLLLGLGLPVLLLAGGAAAFFVNLGQGSGTSHATDGTTTTITVTIADAGSTMASGASSPAGLVPAASFSTSNGGASGQAVIFKLTAPSPAVIHNLSVAPKVDDSGNIFNENTGLPAVGCLGSWFADANSPASAIQAVAGTPGAFTVGNTVTLPLTVSTTATYVADLRFLQDSGTDQGACSGISPTFTLTAS